jgi:hypothetical protein
MRPSLNLAIRGSEGLGNRYIRESIHCVAAFLGGIKKPGAVSGLFTRQFA